MIRVNFKLADGAKAPAYATEGAAGMDLHAHFEGSLHSVLVPVCGRALVKTGVSIELPKGYEAQVRPRSGLAAKYGVTVLNAPGTIDEDYRGEIGVILVNHGDEDFWVHKGDRIAQLVIAKVERANFVVIEDLSQTERGAGGFGHTGV